MKPVWQQSLNVRLNLVGTRLNLSALIIASYFISTGTLRIARRIAIWQCKLWQTTGKSREPGSGLGFFIGHGGRRQGGLGRGNNKQSLLRKRPLIGWVTTVSDWLGSPGDNRWFHPQRFEVIGFKWSWPVGPQNFPHCPTPFRFQGRASPGMWYYKKDCLLFLCFGVGFFPFGCTTWFVSS